VARQTEDVERQARRLFGADWRRSVLEDIVKDAIKLAVLGSASLLFAEATDLIDVGKPLIIGCVTVLVLSVILGLVVAGARRKGPLGTALGFSLLFSPLVAAVLLVSLDRLRPELRDPIQWGVTVFICLIAIALFALVFFFRLRERRARRGASAVSPDRLRDHR
jgi:sugar phosphate permease